MGSQKREGTFQTETVTENPSNEGFCFLKLSEFKQLKSFVRIGWNQSTMKISIIHSQHSLPFLSIKMSCNKNLNLTIRFRYNLRFKKRLWDFRLFIFFKQKRQLERYLVQPPSQPKIQFRFLPFISHILRCYSLSSITHCQF